MATTTRRGRPPKAAQPVTTPEVLPLNPLPPTVPPAPQPQPKLKLRVSPTGRFRIFAQPLGVYFVPNEWVEIEPHPWVLRQIQLGSLKAED